MKHRQIIPYLEKCSAIIDLNVKTNNLLSEFSFSESITLSRLFKSYCMNVYGSPVWR